MYKLTNETIFVLVLKMIKIFHIHKIQVIIKRRVLTFNSLYNFKI